MATPKIPRTSLEPISEDEPTPRPSDEELLHANTFLSVWKAIHLDLISHAGISQDTLPQNGVSVSGIADKNEAFSVYFASIEKIREWVRHEDNQKVLAQVKTLNLRAKKLAFLPEEIQFLTGLESLDISHNQLLVIPDWIGSLAKLQFLDISYNGITNFPKSLGNLINLSSFIWYQPSLLEIAKQDAYALVLALLQQKKLITELEKLSIQTDLQGLTATSQYYRAFAHAMRVQATAEARAVQVKHDTYALQVWEAAYNDLVLNREVPVHFLPAKIAGSFAMRRIEEWVGREANRKLLTKVKSLDLQSKKLEFLPDLMKFFTGLHKLDLSNNSLQELPDYLGSFDELEELDISNNPLQHLPASLGKLLNLKVLKMEAVLLSEAELDDVAQFRSVLSLIDFKSPNVPKIEQFLKENKAKSKDSLFGQACKSITKKILKSPEIKQQKERQKSALLVIQSIFEREAETQKTLLNNLNKFLLSCKYETLQRNDKSAKNYDYIVALYYFATALKLQAYIYENLEDEDIFQILPTLFFKLRDLVKDPFSNMHLMIERGYLPADAKAYQIEDRMEYCTKEKPEEIIDDLLFFILEDDKVPQFFKPIFLYSIELYIRYNFRKLSNPENPEKIALNAKYAKEIKNWKTLYSYVLEEINKTLKSPHSDKKTSVEMRAALNKAYEINSHLSIFVKKEEPLFPKMEQEQASLRSETAEGILKNLSLEEDTSSRMARERIRLGGEQKQKIKHNKKAEKAKQQPKVSSKSPPRVASKKIDNEELIEEEFNDSLIGWGIRGFREAPRAHLDEALYTERVRGWFDDPSYELFQQGYSNPESEKYFHNTRLYPEIVAAHTFARAVNAEFVNTHSIEFKWRPRETGKALPCTYFHEDGTINEDGYLTFGINEENAECYHRSFTKKTRSFVEQNIHRLSRLPLDDLGASAAYPMAQDGSSIIASNEHYAVIYAPSNPYVQRFIDENPAQDYPASKPYFLVIYKVH